MKTKHVESMEELVFKNKNKLYGAYLLRRKYQKHLMIALLFGLFAVLSAISYPLIAAYLNPNHGIHTGQNNGSYDPIAPPSDTPPPPPPPPPPPVPIVPDRIRFVPPTVVDKEIESGLVTQGELTGQPANPLPPDIIDIPPVDNTKNTIEQPVPPEKPYINVAIMPEFPGGEPELFKFLAQNLRYPAEAREIGVTGKVYVYFVIEPDGSISNISILRGIGSGCDEEALRVVRLMPKWNPGIQGGHAVRVQYHLPVKFILQ